MMFCTLQIFLSAPLSSLLLCVCVFVFFLLHSFSFLIFFTFFHYALFFFIIALFSSFLQRLFPHDKFNICLLCLLFALFCFLSYFFTLFHYALSSLSWLFSFSSASVSPPTNLIYSSFVFFLLYSLPFLIFSHFSTTHFPLHHDSLFFLLQLLFPHDKSNLFFLLLACLY